MGDSEGLDKVQAEAMPACPQYILPTRNICITDMKEMVTRSGFYWTPVLGLVLMGSIFLLFGCDLAGEEDLGRLPGSWQVTDLSVDETSVTAQLDARYDRMVLTLRRGAEGEEFFSLAGHRQGEGGVRTVQGTFDKDDGELTLTTNDVSPTASIEVNYTISETTAPVLELRADEEEGDALLNLIQFSIQGAVDQVHIRLSKE